MSYIVFRRLKFILLCLPFFSQASDISQVESRFLYWTLQHINWDASVGNGPLTFCALTTSDYSSVHTLANYQSVRSGQYFLEFEFFKEIEPLVNYKVEHGCHLFYFEAIFDNMNIQNILQSAKRQGFLTIGQSEKFVQQNGNLAFIKKENKLILMTNAPDEEAKFKFSDILLTHPVLGK
ncbi:YfiR family protein [Catenovulum sediminis]|uniref:YfiR family protein n=1 Tax=Catenovulum sediminis TaxID=1740262 RepID=A0ABV1RK47_9ALTE|nr:YfiR family protein [Catenovulum sediminis]